jgi:hypothetical protein
MWAYVQREDFQLKLVRVGLATLTTSLALAAPAVAAPLVTGTTGAATYLTRTTALLQGIVHSNGQLTFWQFQYGRSKGYGSNTMPRTITAGHGDVPVAIRVRGLNRRTLYHFRLVTQWGQGSQSFPINLSFGADRRFVTRAAGDFGLGPRSFTLQNRFVPISLYCASGKRCAGRLRLTIVKSGHRTVVARRRIRLAGKTTHRFSTALSPAAMSHLEQSGSQLTVHLTLVPRDGRARLTAPLHLKRA